VWNTLIQTCISLKSIMQLADFCARSGMRIKRKKSVATEFDFKQGVALPADSILYEGVPLTRLAPDDASLG
jgi:hypothetical protein